MRIVKEDKNILRMYFDSVDDFFQNSDAAAIKAKGISHLHNSNHDQIEKISETKQDNWRYADEKSKDKFEKTRFDPSKGKKMCLEAVKSTMADKSYKKLMANAMTYRRKPKFQDVGSRLSIPRAIAGEDKYFVSLKSARKPTVKIAINICGSASVNAEAFAKVARTAIPTIYALEQAGITTEVYYCAFSNGTHEGYKYSELAVKVKSAQQRFSWTLFAPIFCVGSYRDNIFTAWSNCDVETDYGLGRPMTESDIQKNNNFGYDSVIGLNAVGAVENVGSIFNKIKLKK
jgi:hypothetical protein